MCGAPDLIASRSVAVRVARSASDARPTPKATRDWAMADRRGPIGVGADHPCNRRSPGGNATAWSGSWLLDVV